MSTLNSSPRTDGFRMPGEFEHHERCWIVWPERQDNFRMGAKPVQEVFVQVAEPLASLNLLPFV